MVFLGNSCWQAYIVAAWQNYIVADRPSYIVPNQKNIYGAALALIAIMYVIIAVASLLATMHGSLWK